MDITETNFYKKVKGFEDRFKASRSMSIVLLLVITYLAFANIKLSNAVVELKDLIENKISNTRTIISPAVTRRVVVDGGETISRATAIATIRSIVGLMEIWNYETVRDNYEEVSKVYLSANEANAQQVNLEKREFFEMVEQQKMSSYFKINKEKSEIHYCKELNGLCALIYGKRRLYVNYNDPYADKDVAYFLFIEPTFYSDATPRGVIVTRRVVFDSEDDRSDGFKSGRTMLNNARKGVLE